MTAPVAPRTSDALIPLAFGVGVALLVAAIVNAVATLRFPGNAPIEQLYAFGITVDLVVAGAILLVRAAVHRKRPRAVAKAGPTLSIIALVLAVVVALAALLFGGFQNFNLAMSDERLRYMSASAGTFYLGAAWCLSFIFGVVGWKAGAPRVNARLSIAALAVSGTVLVFLLIASVSYALALTD